MDVCSSFACGPADLSAALTAARALTASIPQPCTATRLPDTPHLLRQARAVLPSAPSSTASNTTRELSGVLPTPAPPPPCPAAAPVRGRGASRALGLPKPKETTTATPVRLSAGRGGTSLGGPRSIEMPDGAIADVAVYKNDVFGFTMSEQRGLRRAVSFALSHILVCGESFCRQDATKLREAVRYVEERVPRLADYESG